MCWKSGKPGHRQAECSSPLEMRQQFMLQLLYHMHISPQPSPYAITVNDIICWKATPPLAATPKTLADPHSAWSFGRICLLTVERTHTFVFPGLLLRL